MRISWVATLLMIVLALPALACRQALVLALDVSGDGRTNVGPTLRSIYGRGIAPDELLSYFENDVLLGVGAFAMVAEGYADYARAMGLKLARELELPVPGQRGPSGNPPG